MQVVAEGLAAQREAGEGGFANPLGRCCCAGVARKRVTPAACIETGAPTNQIQCYAFGDTKMCLGARPAPVSSVLDQAGPNRILFNVKHGCPEMFFIERNRMKASLPEMAGLPQSEVQTSGVIAVDALQGTR